MPPALRPNPAKLNPLQLKTMAILQELARHPQTATRDETSGEVLITQLPHAHGDHMHVGPEAVVATRDATGLNNPAVFAVLERRGLVRALLPYSIFVTPAGLEYPTGISEKIIYRSSH